MSESVEKVESATDARRRILNIAVSTVLLETGFESADKMALETLTEMLQCFFSEIGNSAKGYCELSGRVEPVIGDVVMSLINMVFIPRRFGTKNLWHEARPTAYRAFRSTEKLKIVPVVVTDLVINDVAIHNYEVNYEDANMKRHSIFNRISLKGLEQYAGRPNRHVIQPLQQAPAPRTPAMLSAGSKAKHAPHIPFHLPPLPDPHAYIRTPTHKQPVTEYEAIREKAATQKRDIEKALTKFLAKTSETHNLFNTEDNQVYPLISCKPTFPAYLPCLLPTDQVFDFDELEYHFQVANRTEDMPADKKDHSDNEGENGGDNENPNNSQENQDTQSASSPDRGKSGG